jgi:hypothetical protein
MQARHRVHGLAWGSAVANQAAPSSTAQIAAQLARLRKDKHG